MSVEQRYHFNGDKNEISAFFEHVMGVKIRYSDGVQEFLLPPDLGEGSLQRISLENGLEIWKTRITLSKSFSCSYNKTSFTTFGIWNEGLPADRGQANSLEYSEYQKGETIYRSGIVYDYVALAFRPRFFGIFPEFQPIIHPDSLSPSETCIFPYRIKAIFEQMHECTMEGLPLRLFMEGKGLELLSELLNFRTEAREAARGSVWPEAEVRCIQRARAIIDENLNENISLPELADLAGINTSKLTGGFRSLYNTSINSYRTRTRMEKAVKLLLSGEYNVSETAYMLGYKSNSHFSETFKKFYDIPPGDYRSSLARLLSETKY